MTTQQTTRQDTAQGSAQRTGQDTGQGAGHGRAGTMPAGAGERATGSTPMASADSKSGPGEATLGGGFDAAGLMNSLPFPVFVVDGDNALIYVNIQAEHFFDASAGYLMGHGLRDVVPSDSQLFAIIDMARARDASLSDYGVVLESPRIGRQTVTINAAPLSDRPGQVVVTLQAVSIAQQIEKQLTHRGAARSVSAMAAMLAHEVKNPLSGIRGAAQLLEQTASEGDTELTRLICEEADRIVSLVNRMEVFTDGAPPERGAVNIHSVLERVRRVAQNGFGAQVRFEERYDPSLPPVMGDHDQLVQVFLNLVKNAVEALDPKYGHVVLGTRYQRGVSLMQGGTDARVYLPILVTVEDNGPGIPEDMQPHLFDPFVTSKRNGSGLGLALVAKIIGDHGGIIGFESDRGRTLFKVSLPMASGPVRRTPEIETAEAE